MYKFSAPMPYNTEDINNLLDVNNNIEKSRITSLFLSLPSNNDLFTGFEQRRNFSFEHKNFEYWKKLISCVFDKGIDVIYLLNSPNGIRIENPNLQKQLERLDKLLNEFRKIGVNKLRVSDNKLLSYLNKHYSDFHLYASTSFEFKIISEYRNFMYVHPYIKQVIPSHDVNKNFRLLKNLKKLNQNINVELIVNEGCINGCPMRNGHASDFIDTKYFNYNDVTLSNYYHSIFFCKKFENIYPILNLVKSNNIYPWEIEEYSKIGINNFKLVGRDAYKNQIKSYIEKYFLYLKAIDDYKKIKNVSINIFNHHITDNEIINQLNIKMIKNLLPNIKYFVKKGHLCASRCGVECFYCYKCAKKIEHIYENKLKKKKRIYIPCAKI